MVEIETPPKLAAHRLFNIETPPKLAAHRLFNIETPPKLAASRLFNIETPPKLANTFRRVLEDFRPGFCSVPQGFASSGRDPAVTGSDLPSLHEVRTLTACVLCFRSPLLFSSGT